MNENRKDVKGGVRVELRPGNVIDFIQSAAVRRPPTEAWGVWSALSAAARGNAERLGFTEEMWDTQCLPPRLYDAACVGAPVRFSPPPPRPQPPPSSPAESLPRRMRLCNYANPLRLTSRILRPPHSCSYTDLAEGEVAACRALGFPERRGDELLRFECASSATLDLFDPRVAGDNLRARVARSRLVTLGALCVLNLSGGCVSTEQLQRLLAGASRGESSTRRGFAALRTLALEDNALQLWIGSAARARRLALRPAQDDEGCLRECNVGLELCKFAVRCEQLTAIQLADNAIGAVGQRAPWVGRARWDDLKGAIERDLARAAAPAEAYVELEVRHFAVHFFLFALFLSFAHLFYSPVQVRLDWEQEARVGVVVHGIASESAGAAVWNGRRGTAARDDVVRALGCAHQPRLGDGGAEGPFFISFVCSILCCSLFFCLLFLLHYSFFAKVPDGSLDFIEQHIEVKFAPSDADRVRRAEVVEHIKWANLALRPAHALVETRESGEGGTEWRLNWCDEIDAEAECASERVARSRLILAGDESIALVGLPGGAASGAARGVASGAAGGALGGAPAGAERGAAAGAEQFGGFRAASGRRVVVTLRGNPCLDDSIDVVAPQEWGLAGPGPVEGHASHLHDIVGGGLKSATAFVVGGALKGARSANAVLRESVAAGVGSGGGGSGALPRGS